MGVPDAELSAVLAQAAEGLIGDFNAQDLANTGWAFATVSRADALLFMALAREAERHASDFTSQNLAHAAWAFVTVGR